MILRIDQWRKIKDSKYQCVQLWIIYKENWCKIIKWERFMYAIF